MVVKSMGYEVWNAPERPEPQKLPGLYLPLLLAYDGSLQWLFITPKKQRSIIPYIP